MALGLAESRTQAGELIEAGLVLVGGAPAAKSSRLVSPGEPVKLVSVPPRYVSRGGEKLHSALERFKVDPTARRALDAGSSTGGFTDCLLRHGAATVVAVDVGRGQLHERLRADPRVRSLEKTDIRSEVLAALRGSFSLVVADLSFIGLRSVAGALVGFAEPGADMVVLVKPQFEAGRAEASRSKGVIRDPAIWRSTLDSAIRCMEDAGAAMIDVMVSPLRGTGGNAEFLSHFKTPRPGVSAATAAAGRESAVAEAVAAAERNAGMPERNAGMPESEAASPSQTGTAKQSMRI